MEHLRRERRIRRRRRRIANRWSSTPRGRQLLFLHQAHLKETVEGFTHARHVQAGLLSQLRDSHRRHTLRNALQQRVLSRRQGSHRLKRLRQRPRMGGVNQLYPLSLLISGNLATMVPDKAIAKLAYL